MTTFVDLEEVDQGVLHVSQSSYDYIGDGGTYDRSSKGPIQPPSPLTNQFGSLLRHIRLCLTRLHITQCPLVAGFGNQFET
jgi:hypothetical protein